MISELLKFLRGRAVSSNTPRQYCYGRLELPPLSPLSYPANSYRGGEIASERLFGGDHGGTLTRLPPLQLRLPYVVRHHRDYGGGVLASLAVTTVGALLLCLLLA